MDTLDSRLTGNYRGKGTPRRKVKKVHKSSGTDDKKLQTALKKLNVQPIQAIEEVNMFKSDGNVIHFSAPKGTFMPVHQCQEAWTCGYFAEDSSSSRGSSSFAMAPSHPMPLLMLPAQFTPQYPQTPSPSTAMVRTRSSPSLFPASLTSSAPTRSHRCANSPRATRACRRRRVRMATRRTMMTRTMMTSPNSSPETTSSQRLRSSKCLSAKRLRRRHVYNTCTVTVNER
jgi:hypothetical protein